LAHLLYHKYAKGFSFVQHFKKTFPDKGRLFVSLRSERTTNGRPYG